MLRLPGLSKVQVLPLGGTPRIWRPTRRMARLRHHAERQFLGGLGGDGKSGHDGGGAASAAHGAAAALPDEAWVVCSDQKTMHMIDLVHRDMLRIRWSSRRRRRGFRPDGTKAYVASAGRSGRRGDVCAGEPRVAGELSRRRPGPLTWVSATTAVIWRRRTRQRDMSRLESAGGAHGACSRQLVRTALLSVPDESCLSVLCPGATG